MTRQAAGGLAAERGAWRFAPRWRRGVDASVKALLQAGLDSFGKNQATTG